MGEEYSTDTRRHMIISDNWTPVLFLRLSPNCATLWAMMHSAQIKCSFNHTAIATVDLASLSRLQLHICQHAFITGRNCDARQSPPAFAYTTKVTSVEIYEY
jgi:hypothetical protein